MDHGRSPQAVAGRGTLWPLEAGARRFDVVGLGENSLDRLGRVARWPEPGGKQEWLEYSEMPGGQMASALVGCARLGLRVAYLGAVGSDAEAGRVLEPLAQEGIDLSGVRRVQGAQTRSATILVRTGDGERSVVAQPTLGLSLRTADLDRSAIEEASLLAVDLSDPDASLWAASIARNAGIPVVLDADRVIEESERLLGLVDFPAVSEDFAKAWAGVASAREGARKIGFARGSPGGDHLRRSRSVGGRRPPPLLMRRIPGRCPRHDRRWRRVSRGADLGALSAPSGRTRPAKRLRGGRTFVPRPGRPGRASRRKSPDGIPGDAPRHGAGRGGEG